MKLLHSTQKKLLIALVVSGAIVFLFISLLAGALLIGRIFYVNQYIIPQNGMYPGKPAGSRLISLRNPYDTIQQVNRGDIIVFAQKNTPRSPATICRVIALPKDTIELLVDGSLIVAGNHLPLLELRKEGPFTIFLESNGEQHYQVAYENNRPKSKTPLLHFTVDEGKLFVVGDNRDNSYDSRNYGAIPFSSVKGKMIW